MAKFCQECGCKLSSTARFCGRCGSSLVIEANPADNKKIEDEKVEPETVKTTHVKSSSGRSRIIAGLLGILLGSLGIHNFYLGYTGKGIAQILITFLSCGMLSGISYLWGLIEGIMILTFVIKEDAYGNQLSG